MADNTQRVEMPPSVSILWFMRPASSTIGFIILSQDVGGGLRKRRMSSTIALVSFTMCGGAEATSELRLQWLKGGYLELLGRNSTDV
jgi:hypothetical protein